MIVSRGLGVGGLGALVAFGLGVAITIVVVDSPLPTPDQSISFGGHYRNYTKPPKIAARISLPAFKAKELVWSVAAKGAAKVVLLTEKGTSEPGTYKAAGAANFTLIGVDSSSRLGTMLASGKHDLSDEEILSAILALLEL